MDHSRDNHNITRDNHNLTRDNHNLKRVCCLIYVNETLVIYHPSYWMVVNVPWTKERKTSDLRDMFL